MSILPIRYQVYNREEHIYTEWKRIFTPAWCEQ